MFFGKDVTNVMSCEPDQTENLSKAEQHRKSQTGSV